MEQRTVIGVVVYLALAYLLLNFVRKSSWRETAFALLNLLMTGAFFFVVKGKIDWLGASAAVIVVTTSYAVMALATTKSRLYLLAVATPVLFLILSRTGVVVTIVGISYLAFRLSHLAFEVHAGRVARPTPGQYAAFAFFPLTYIIGPISPYSLFQSSLSGQDEGSSAPMRAFARIAVGAVKCLLFAPIFQKVSFRFTWFDYYFHGPADFLMAAVGSYLFLYLNFAGACDMIIGAAALLEIRVKENFDSPLLARNIREFWNRFHITLSDYVRDVVFTPTLYLAGRSLGPMGIALVTSSLLLLIFFLIGVWHGTGRNFVILGLLHGMAMTIYYLYTLLLKRLPPAFRRASETFPMRVLSTALTFSFVSFTSLFFENDWNRLMAIKHLFKF